jgi:hypothetical protein
VDTRQPVRADLHDPLARSHATGEADTVHAGVAHEMVAHLGVAGDDVDHAIRNAGLAQHLGKRIRVQRCLGGRFGDDGAPGQQRRCELDHEQGERGVPRDDKRRDPGRLAPHHGGALDAHA